MRVRTICGGLILMAPLLASCTMVQAQAGTECSALGFSIGRGFSTVTCTPSKKTIIIPPPTSSEVDTSFVWMEKSTEPPSDTSPINDQTYETLLNDICLTNGCTIIETSSTGIDVKGGPPDKNVVTGVFDSLFSVGTWLATKYFATGF